MKRLLARVLHPSAEGTTALFVTDCVSMIDRPMDGWGAPPAVDVPLYGSLRRCCHLMELVNKTVSAAC
jgi:hypothetical protein